MTPIDTAVDPATTTASLPFSARGPLTETVMGCLASSPDERAAELLPATEAAVAASRDLEHDDDVQLALFLFYAVAYGALPQLHPAWEWQADAVASRTAIEAAFEAHLRSCVPVPASPAPERDAVAQTLFAMTAPSPRRSLSGFVARTATLGQLREFLVHRSVATLRDADPHARALPRLHGRARAALEQVHVHEYGAVDAAHVQAAVFARTVRGAGLDTTYGAYLDLVPAITLAACNTVSMFGLNRRLRGAIVGHLAAFEMTSSLPNRRYGDGLRRLGFGPEVTEYFDDHVDADPVHEQLAGRDMAGALAEDEPALLPDILFGAAACLVVDGWISEHILTAFETGRSSLRQPALTP